MSSYTVDIEEAEKRPNLNIISKLIRFSEYLLEEMNIGKNYEQEDLVIIGLFRQLVEQVDGVFIGMDQDSIGLARTSQRNAFETSLSLKYLLRDPTQIKRRALSYTFNDISEHLKWIDYALKTGVLKEEISKDELIKRKELLLKKSNSKDLNGIKKEWLKTKKSQKNKDVEPKWYSLFNGPTSIRKLAKHLGEENTYLTSYGNLSFETHGNKALEKVAISETGDLLIWPFRDDYNDDESAIIRGKSMLLEAIYNIISYYKLEELYKEFLIFFKENIEPLSQ